MNLSQEDGVKREVLTKAVPWGRSELSRPIAGEKAADTQHVVAI